MPEKEREAFRRAGRGNGGCTESSRGLRAPFRPHPLVHHLSQSSLWGAERRKNKYSLVFSVSEKRKSCDLSHSICNSKYIKVGKLGKMPGVDGTGGALIMRRKNRIRT